MNFLAIETSTEACSVALQAGGTILDRHIVEARSHTRVLLPCITDLLQEADIGVADLDTIVLGNGPGSFIGMRIGASVAQGLAYGAGIDPELPTAADIDSHEGELTGHNSQQLQQHPPGNDTGGAERGSDDHRDF